MMRRQGGHVVSVPLTALALSSLTLAGCGGAGILEPYAVRLGPAAVSPGGRVAELLAADDGSDDEDVGFITTPSPAPAPVAVPREWRLGVRTGFLATTSSDEGWDSAVSFGAFYRGRPRGRAGYELGIDLATLDSEDGSTSSRLLFLRGDVLFGRWDEDGRKAGVYLLAGAQAASEEADLTGAGKTLSAVGGAANLGVGIGSPKGSWDVRAVYSILLGSDNAAGDVALSAAFAF